MKKSVAMEWAKALRSGKYKQGKSVLRYRDSFCCLGVLCDISKQGKWVDRKTGQIATYYECEGDYSLYVLPNEVRKFSGVKSSGGSHRTVSGGKRSLFSYNDGVYVDPSTGEQRAATFDEMADWIEVNYKAL